MHELMRRVPAGDGRRRRPAAHARASWSGWSSSGVPFLAERGLASEDDLAHTEEGGAMPGADADAVSQKALRARACTQVGSLGAGNHFLEVQVVDEVVDRAGRRGLRRRPPARCVVMIHSGSRGFGHQTCTDHLARMDRRDRFGFELPDRQLACAPVGSPEGRDYLAAMACACNFAFANRQVMMHEVRGAFEHVFRASRERLGVGLVYDVAHNIAKLETHVVDGVERSRLGAPQGGDPGLRPGSPRRPRRLPRRRPAGHHPRRHGPRELAAGRRRRGHERDLRLDLPRRRPAACRARAAPQGAERRRGAARARGARHRGHGAASTSLLAEEAPYAYKDVAEVVGVVEAVGLSRRVARLRPLGVLKG